MNRQRSTLTQSWHVKYHHSWTYKRMKSNESATLKFNFFISSKIREILQFNVKIMKQTMPMGSKGEVYLEVYHAFYVPTGSSIYANSNDLNTNENNSKPNESATLKFNLSQLTKF